MEIGGDSEMGVELSLMSLGGQVLFHYNLLHLTLDNCGDSAYHHLIHNYNAVVSLGFLFRHHWTDTVPTHQAAYDVDSPIFSFHLDFYHIFDGLTTKFLSFLTLNQLVVLV